MQAFIRKLFGRLWTLLRSANPQKIFYWLRIIAFFGLIAFVANATQIADKLLDFGREVVALFTETIDEGAETIKAGVDTGFDEMKAQQEAINQRLDAIETHKEEVIEEVHKLGEQLTGERPGTNHGTTASAVHTPQQGEVVEDDKPLSITPSTPLSEDDRITQTRDESLYIKERKRNTITPASKSNDASLYVKERKRNVLQPSE